MLKLFKLRIAEDPLFTILISALLYIVLASFGTEWAEQILDGILGQRE